MWLHVACEVFHYKNIPKLIWSLRDGHLGFSSFGAHMNKAVVDIKLWCLLVNMNIISVKYLSSSGNAEC